MPNPSHLSPLQHPILRPSGLVVIEDAQLPHPFAALESSLHRHHCSYLQQLSLLFTLVSPLTPCFQIDSNRSTEEKNRNLIDVLIVNFFLILTWWNWIDGLIVKLIVIFFFFVLIWYLLDWWLQQCVNYEIILICKLIWILVSIDHPFPLLSSIICFCISFNKAAIGQPI